MCVCGGGVCARAGGQGPRPPRVKEDPEEETPSKMSHMCRHGSLPDQPSPPSLSAISARPSQTEPSPGPGNLCPTLCDPIDGSPPGSIIPGILQARTLECKIRLETKPIRRETSKGGGRCRGDPGEGLRFDSVSSFRESSLPPVETQGQGLSRKRDSVPGQAH